MSKFTAHILLFLSSFLWGVNFISMKYLAGVTPPFSMLFIRFVIASLFLWSLLIYKRKKKTGLLKLQRADYKMMFITGFIGMAIYFYFQMFAFNYLTANTAALLCALIPIFSLIGEMVVHKKKCHPLVYIFCLTSLLGVYLVLNMNMSELIGSGLIKGILLMVGSLTSWVIYTLITGDLQNKYGSLSALTFQSTVGALIFATTAPIDMKEGFMNIMGHPSTGIIIFNLFFLGICSSALAYLCYIEGMKQVGLQLASLYMNIIPIITAMASFIVFKENLTLLQISGIGIVVISIILINKVEEKQSKKTLKKEDLSPVLAK